MVNGAQINPYIVAFPFAKSFDREGGEEEEEENRRTKHMKSEMKTNAAIINLSDLKYLAFVLTMKGRESEEMCHVYVFCR